MGRRLVVTTGATWAMPTKSTPTSVLAMAVLPRGQRHSSHVRISQLYTACFALDSFRRKTWSDDPGNKMIFLPRWPQPRHLERDELQRIHMRATRQEGLLGIEPPSRRATRHHHFELEKATAHDLFQKECWACKQKRAEGFLMIYSNVVNYTVNPLR
jgi:hypothetical protein